MVCCISIGLCVVFCVLYLANMLLGKFCRVKGLNRKAVLITGCDSGMGKGLALSLAKQNMQVYAGCLTTQGMAAFSSTPNIKPVQLDVTDQAAVDAVRQIIEDDIRTKKIDVLWAVVNNAGWYRTELLELAEWNDWKMHFEVNVFGTARMIKTFLPLLRRSKGRIVNVSSASVMYTPPFHTAYCGTKYAIEGMSDALRRELAPWGVKVVIVEPGVTQTPLFDADATRDIDKAFERMTEEQKKLYGRDFLVHVKKEKKDGLKIVAGPVSAVIATLETATLARFPSTRYTTGVDSIGYRIVYYLPTRSTDWFTGFTLAVRPG
eukprot:TRINITY_DN62577_c0_g1_i1.p1 TRINITY_DN62577_c0_g1~~TRINITY_DN62577_c0_g1_i1.p1  ORF type:complete len:320 (+),score=8.91 TRINITY_DN62577_c0_g1_i1:67-1026(+)